MKTAVHGRRRWRCSSLAARASRESYYYRVVCKRRGSFMRRRPSKVGWLLIVKRISRTPVHCTRSPRPRNFYPKLSFVPPLSVHRAYRDIDASFFVLSPIFNRILVYTNSYSSSGTRIINLIRLRIDELPGGLFPKFSIIFKGAHFYTHNRDYFWFKQITTFRFEEVKCAN